MLQIVNFFLEKPDKLGKTFTLVLQLLLTVWFTNAILVYLNLINVSSESAGTIWNLGFIENISLISIICYILVGAACWFILWYLAPTIVIALLYFFDVIVRWPFKKLLIAVGFIIYGIRWALRWLSRKPAPFKFWKKETEEEEDTFNLNQQQLWGLLDIVRKVDKTFTKPFGSQLLLMFLDADKTGNALSKVHKYFQIVLMAFVGGLAFSEKLSNGLLVTMIITLSLFSLMIVAFMDFLDRIHSTDSSYARQRAQATISAHAYARDIETSYLGQFYNVEYANQKVGLKLKRQEDKKRNGFFRPSEITFIIANKISPEFLEKWLELSQRVAEKDHLTVLISDNEPSAVAKNLIEEKNYGFIYNDSAFPFKESLPKIKTFLLSNTKIKRD